MYASALTRAAGMALAVAMLSLTSGLAGAKLPAPTEEQKAQADLAKAKAAWGDKVTAFQTCKAQDKVVASYQAGGKAVHAQPGAPCVDPGAFVAPVPPAPAPAPAAKG